MWKTGNGRENGSSSRLLLTPAFRSPWTLTTFATTEFYKPGLSEASRQKASLGIKQNGSVAGAEPALALSCLICKIRLPSTATGPGPCLWVSEPTVFSWNTAPTPAILWLHSAVPPHPWGSISPSKMRKHSLRCGATRMSCTLRPWCLLAWAMRMHLRVCVLLSVLQYLWELELV